MRTRKPPCPVEKVWVDKHKYDEAERLHYEREAMLAAAAPEDSSTTSPGPAGDQNELLSRISHLEVENQNLRSVVADLQMAIFKLESRLNALEKSSTSHQPSPVPPTQVSLGRVVFLTASRS
uniref:Uncharacterized protein n=1 Tax=Athene cunicularia TaxID=194338 RepID=A0A663LS24_ATHCN